MGTVASSRTLTSTHTYDPYGTTTATTGISGRPGCEHLSATLSVGCLFIEEC